MIPVRSARADVEPAGAMAGVRPSDEHQPRIWNAIAMWVGGGTTIAASTLLSLPSGSDVSALRALAGFCFAAAAFSFVVFRPASNRALYVLTNTFSTLGALTVWLACHWSGGQASGLIGLYFFPVLYDAYFFRRPHMLAHLVLNSALVVSPLAYGTATAGAQFPGRLAVTLLALWGMSALVGARKRRLLAAELSTRRQALSDPLTGVHNVRSVRRLIERRSADPEPADAQCAALMIDIDDFKDMNGRHGHLGADGLLRELASALQSLAHEGDCVARIGGDEFAMLVFGRSEAELGRLAEQCAAAVSTAHRRAGLGSARVSASVGFAHSRRHGANLERLLQLADEAMYERKAARSRGGANLTLVPGEGAPPGGHGAEGAHEKPAASDPLAPATHPSPSAPEIASAPATGISLPARLRSRPTQVKVAAAAWLSGAGATALVLVLPHADRSHLAAVIALTVAAVLVGSLLLALSPAAGGAVYDATDTIAIGAIGFGAYLTGGGASPLLTLVLLGIAYAACFYSPPATLARLAGAAAVCASPLAYSGAAVRLAYVVPFLALLTTTVVLAGILLYSTRKLALAERRSRDLASQDPLTGLPNRRAFEHAVNEALARRGGEEAGSLAIAIVDLDNFKRVNDRHGHAAGDSVLRGIAAALGAAARDEDLVARIGGDEFALIVRRGGSGAVQSLGSRCIAAVERAAGDAGFGDCLVSATVGFALCPQHGNGLEDLLHAADEALMGAKADGKRTVTCARALRATG